VRGRGRGPVPDLLVKAEHLFGPVAAVALPALVLVADRVAEFYVLQVRLPRIAGLRALLALDADEAVRRLRVVR
jgi:hypothetical protein